MSYKRKTMDVWEIHGDMGQGWEILTAEVTYKMFKENWKAYRENQPEIPLKKVKKRERLVSETT